VLEKSVNEWRVVHSFFFFRSPPDAEWEEDEGMCLALNSAELPWQALLQGYREINRKEIRLQNLEMCIYVHIFYLLPGGRDGFLLLISKTVPRGPSAKGCPGRPVLHSSC